MTSTQTASTKSEKENISDTSDTLKIHLTEQETLHVEKEDEEIYLTLHSPGCIQLRKRSVEEALFFTMPELTVREHLMLSRDILNQIITKFYETQR